MLKNWKRQNLTFEKNNRNCRKYFQRCDSKNKSGLYYCFKNQRLAMQCL